MSGWKCGRTFRAYFVTKQEVTEYTKVLFYALVVREVGVNKSDSPIRNKAFTVTERSQPKGVKPEMKRPKLRSIKWLKGVK